MGRCEYVKTWKAAKISPNIPGGDLFMVHHINWFTDAPVIYGFCEALAKFKIINGVAYTAIKLYISTWVLRMLVDPMYFYFEKTGAKRVKQYEGRLTPSDEKGNPLVGKVVFSYDF